MPTEPNRRRKRAMLKATASRCRQTQTPIQKQSPRDRVTHSKYRNTEPLEQQIDKQNNDPLKQKVPNENNRQRQTYLNPQQKVDPRDPNAGEQQANHTRLRVQNPENSLTKTSRGVHPQKVVSNGLKTQNPTSPAPRNQYRGPVLAAKRRLKFSTRIKGLLYSPSPKIRNSGCRKKTSPFLSQM